MDQAMPGRLAGRPRWVARPRDRWERGLTLTSGFIVAAWLWLTLSTWSDLPDLIPIHFDLTGRIDSWAGRTSLLTLWVIGLGLAALLTWVANVPHALNYPWSITTANANQHYKLARRLLFGLRFHVCLTFAAVYAYAINSTDGSTPSWFGIFIALALLGPVLMVGSYLIFASSVSRH